MEESIDPCADDSREVGIGLHFDRGPITRADSFNHPKQLKDVAVLLQNTL